MIHVTAKSPGGWGYDEDTVVWLPRQRLYASCSNALVTFQSPFESKLIFAVISYPVKYDFSIVDL